MDKHIQKLRLLFVPFILLTIAIVGGYTLLNWLLLIQLKLFVIDEDVVNIGLPLATPWIPLIIWLRPRIKRLHLKTKRSSYVDLYLAIAGFSIVIPLVIAQFYIDAASGTITKLENIQQIAKTDTKYYSLPHYYIHKAGVSTDFSFDVSGRYREDLNMHLYYALPILNSPADTAGNFCAAWYGIEYAKTISNKYDKAQKEDEYNKFVAESDSRFAQAEIGPFVYLKRLGKSDDHEGFNGAIRNSHHYKNETEIVLTPEYEPYSARTGSSLGWIFKSFILIALLWLIMILLPRLADPTIDAPEEEKAKVVAVGEGRMIDILIPKGDFFITPIIVNLNILVFILMMFSGMGFMSFKATDLLSWGGNFRPATTDGEWWRLLTNIFLHGGLMHLLANMYGLFFVGIFLEPLLGRLRYTLVYLITGIIASLSSIWWHPATVSVGASGAIFGVYGLFLTFLFLKVFPKEMSKPFLVSTLIFVGFNLLMGFAGNGIDNAAHIGGLLSGMLAGILLYPRVKKEEQENTPSPVFDTDKSAEQL